MPLKPPDALEPVELAGPYLDYEEIDFGRMLQVLRGLVFFDDDLFLNMQAINVALVDHMITEMEYSLLCELHEIERTPTDSAMLVSALAQMWSFGLYELLRTWRERVRNFRKQAENGMLATLVRRLEIKGEERKSTAALIHSRQARALLDDPSLLAVADTHWDALRPAYEALELFRINLAKHKAPGKENILSDFPGYGRINGFCGALDFSLTGRDGTDRTMSRRDIADLLRATNLP